MTKKGKELHECRALSKIAVKRYVSVGIVTSTLLTNVAVDLECVFRYSTMTLNSLLPLYASTSLLLLYRIRVFYDTVLIADV